MASQPAVLLLGIHWDDKDFIPADFREKLKTSLETACATAKDEGVDMVFQSATLGNVDEIKKVLASRKWAGVCIGNGIRKQAEFTVWFEQVIEATRNIAPQAKLIFNTLPDDTLEAVGRWIPLKSRS